MAGERTRREEKRRRSNAKHEGSRVEEPCVPVLTTANSGAMKHLSTYLAVLALAPAVLGAQSSADLVLTNGHIYTVDNARPVATALAVLAGRVLFVGSDAEARALATSSTNVIDLHGAKIGRASCRERV